MHPEDLERVRQRAASLMAVNPNVTREQAIRRAYADVTGDARRELDAAHSNPGSNESGYLRSIGIEPSRADRRATSIGRTVPAPLPPDTDVLALRRQMMNAQAPTRNALGMTRPAWRVPDDDAGYQTVDDMVRAFANSATLGGADWLAGAANPRGLAQGVREEHAATRNAEMRSPLATGVAEMAGMFLPYSIPGRMLAAGKTAKAIATGAGMGAGHGAMKSDPTPGSMARGFAYALPDAGFNSTPLRASLIPLGGMGIGGVTGYDPYHHLVDGVRGVLGMREWGPGLAVPPPEGDPLPVSRR